MNPFSESNSTIEYYNKNSSEFISRTIDVDMSESYDNFLRLLPDGGSILDAGCGSGRDAKKFDELGFAVSAFDASEEMVKHATQYAGIPVQHLRFDQLKYEGEFDGVWACASLLHVQKDDFDSALQHLVKALRMGGVLYMSLKEGASKVPDGGRHFSYFRECEVKEIVGRCADLELDCLWVSESPDCTWLNVVAKRV